MLQIPITPTHYLNTLIVVVLDLSKLSSILASLSFWLNTIRNTHPTRSYDNLVPEDSLKSLYNTIWTSHEDRKYIDPMPIPVMVVANKYDSFIKEDP